MRPPVVAPVKPEPASDNTSDTGTEHKAGMLPPTAFWVGVGVTAFATGITIWSGLDTQSNPGADKVRSACSSGDPSCHSLYDQGRSKQTRTNVLLGVTAGVAVATGVIGAFFTDWSGGEKSAKAEAKAQRRGSRRGLTVEPWLTIGSGASVGRSEGSSAWRNSSTPRGATARRSL